MAAAERPGSREQEPEASEGGEAEGAGRAVRRRACPELFFFSFSVFFFFYALTRSLHLPMQQVDKDGEDGELEHRRRWEAGRADYLGKDAFRNIQKMLDCFLDQPTRDAQSGV